MVKTIQKRKLTLKQELFCQYFVFDEETQSNATLSYQKAYNVDKQKKDWYGLCSSEGCQNLRKPSVSLRISELLNLYLDDNLADSELAWVMTQKDELGPKVSAIKEYNQLKGRITEKHDITSGGEKIEKINYIVPINPNGNNAKPNLETTLSK